MVKALRARDLLYIWRKRMYCRIFGHYWGFYVCWHCGKALCDE